MAQAVSDAAGRVRILKPADGTYTFRETKAPEGYEQNMELLSFTVSGKGQTQGAYWIENRPEIVAPKIGRITALYSPASLRGEAGGSAYTSVRTGDSLNGEWYLAGLLASAAVFVLAQTKRRKRK